MARIVSASTILADFASLSIDEMAKVRAALGIVATPAEPRAASHYILRDVACKAIPPCERTDLAGGKASLSHTMPGGHVARNAAEIARLAAKRATK